jgi:hypothetical protein
MKTTIFIIIILLFSFLGAEDIPMTENPAAPTAKNAGRTITLKEIMRITDAQGGFYFKKPGNIKIAPDESIYVVDNDQFMRFDKTGRFLNNQHKVGEGPGEYSYCTSYRFLNGKTIRICNQPSKILETDPTGKLLQETKINLPQTSMGILGLDCGKYWYLSADTSAIINKNTGYIDVTQEVAWTTAGGKPHKTGIVFAEKWYINKVTQGKSFYISIFHLYPELYVMDEEKSLYVSATGNYMIQRINLETEKVCSKFRRKYSSVPFQPEKQEGPKPRSSPLDTEFFGDVQQIIPRGGSLWILTSTITKGKGILVDVFTKDGKYIDNFYLPLPQVETVHNYSRLPIALYKDFLFTVEHDEDENPQIVKYKVELQ